MATPARLAKKLRQVLGPEAGGDLVTWLDEMRAEHERFRVEVAALHQRFDKVDERLSNIRDAVADSKAELMKWSLVFWVGAVGAIAALAGVLRQ